MHVKQRVELLLGGFRKGGHFAVAGIVDQVIKGAAAKRFLKRGFESVCKGRKA